MPEAPVVRHPQLTRKPEIRVQRIGYCIYCGSRTSLTDEHIVALALGGNILLPESSCRPCAAITSKAERHVARETWIVLRALSAYPSRRRTGMPTQRAVDFEYRDGRKRTMQIPIEHVPASLVLPRVPLPPFVDNVEGFPRLLPEQDHFPTLRLVTVAVDGASATWPDVFKKWAPNAVRGSIATGGVRVEMVARLIWKVSVAYAVLVCPDVLAASDLPRKVIDKTLPRGPDFSDLYSIPSQPLQGHYFRARIFTADGLSGSVVYCGVTLLGGFDETEHICAIGPARGAAYHSLLSPDGLSVGASGF